MQPTIKQIQLATCEAFALPLADLLSVKRSRPYSEPRYVAFLLCRMLTLKSYPQIGRAFKRDHTTVITGIKSARLAMIAKPLLRSKFEAVAAILEGVTK